MPRTSDREFNGHPCGSGGQPGTIAGVIGSHSIPPNGSTPWVRGLSFATLFLIACGGGSSEPPPAESPYEDRSHWPVREQRDEPFDVLHYRVALDLDETTKGMDGTVDVHLQAEEEISEVTLDAETYEVRGVRAGGDELDFTHADGTLTVTLAEPLAAGETLTLRIAYGGTGIDVDATQYGMPASYDLGLDFKDETDANPQLINTLSFPEGARHWYPSVDHPADRSTFELLATVREDWKVLSNGVLIGISEGSRPGTRTHHWRLDLPHPTYLSVLVAGPYEVIEDFHGDIPVNYWVYPKDVEDAHRSFHKTTAMMAFFDEEFGVPYPWNKYDQITIPGIGGGAESTTATVLGQSTIHDERAEQDFPSHGLVAHEVAHHWWGDLTTYRDWGETWLTESFGTYSEYLWHAHELGSDEAGENMRRKRESYLRQAQTVLRPVVTNQWRRPNDNFDAHTYPKGAALIRLLRHITGDAEFRAGIKHFLEKHSFQPVDTEDFITAFAEATGQDIRWFIDMWLRRPGHPVLEIESAWDGDSVEMHIRQVQGPEASMGTVPEAYRAPLSVRVVTESGSEIHPLTLEGQEQHLSFPAAEEPRYVRFDADDVLLAELNITKPLGEWLAQLADDDAAGRRRAAVALGEMGGDDARAALRETLASDPFWSVRQAAVAGLDPEDADDAEAMRTAATDDAKSDVRTAATARLGASAGAEFLIERFRNDSSYRAQAAAVTALGEIGGDAAAAVLEAAAAMSSPRDIVARAAREVRGTGQ